MREDAPIVVPKPDPLTILIPVWGVVFGVGGALLYGNRPSTSAATQSIPPFGVWVFFIGLAVTCAAILLGMWLRNVIGLKLKLGGNIALGSLCLVYSSWIVQAIGFVRPFLAVSILMTICVASFWQARRLNAVLNPRG